ncbi:MAG TPA: hypothetical protein VMY77_16540 [Chitinophagaceae bacterium]|nr:hypothetical protein [Chitinophagaceae bacterium]
MKKNLNIPVLLFCALLVSLFFAGCTKKDNSVTPATNVASTQAQRIGSTAPADPAIAYVSNNNLMVMNADGSNQTVIVSGGAGAPSWSPEAHSIVFTRAGGLWIVDVSVVNGVSTGSNLHRIPFTLSGTQGSPSWSPAGDLIAFTNASAGSEYDRNIYTISPAGGTPAIVYTSANGLSPRQPDWSPDGSKIVFSEATDASPYQWNLLVFDRSTSQLTEVIPLSSSIAVKASAWSRNGDRIAYSNGNGSPEAIYTVAPTANATPVKVIDGAFPTWSPGDLKLAFNGNKPAGIYSYTFSTGTRQKLADGTWADWRRF